MVAKLYASRALIGFICGSLLWLMRELLSDRLSHPVEASSAAISLAIAAGAGVVLACLYVAVRLHFMPRLERHREPLSVTPAE